VTKLRILIRFTDLLTFFDLEGTDRCRMALTTRGRQERPTMLEGTDDDVINRGLAIVEAGLPHPLKEVMHKELDRLLFPTFEEFVRQHMTNQGLETLTAESWFERYRVAKESYNEYGSEPPLGVKVKAFNPDLFGHYRTYILKAHNYEGLLDEDRLLLVPNSSEDQGFMPSWVIPKSEWWRFVTIVPNDA
jgi:hypothetical protein